MTGIIEFLGIDRRHAPWRERIVSGLGGGIGILSIFLISRATVGPGAGLIVASMGASAVLLFAVPHGPLSQPWQLLAGHLASAAIGVICARTLADPVLAGPLAVGLAIFAMRILGCVHPPGGATALSAVISGPTVTQLGFGYLVTPVLLNALVLLAVAILFNYPFPWRRYPAALHARVLQEIPPATAQPVPPAVDRPDLVYALSEMDTFVDVSEADLQRIYEIALRHHAEEAHVAPQDVLPGHYFSNGRYGADWQVREVIDITPVGDEGRQVVRFRVAAGQGRLQTGKSGLLEFARWAKYPVVRNENSWQKVSPADSTGHRSDAEPES